MTAPPRRANPIRRTVIETGRGGPEPAPATPPLPSAPPSPSGDDVNLHDTGLYINRELSWLEFNQRVLFQAQDPHHRLLERVKFLAIVGTNLDEFFMVRVATLNRKFQAGSTDVSPDGLSTAEQLTAIRRRVRRMMVEQARCWSEMLRPELAEHGIRFLEPADYTEEIGAYLRHYFQRNVHPVLTPLAFDPGHPFPFISNLSMNLAVAVRHEGRTRFARVKLPPVLPQFIRLPDQVSGQPGHTFVFLSDIVKAGLDLLFPGVEVDSAYLFRIIRDTDMVIQEDEADDLLETVDRSLKQLRWGELSQLLVESDMPARVLDILMENFEIQEDVVERTADPMAYGDWMELTTLNLPQLKDTSFSPRVLWGESDLETVFEQIRERDHLVHHPFDSFSSVETFVRAAVEDAHVAAIKMTLYRIGADSPLIDLLVQAAEAGKQVAVLVELKARFDERNNIAWAHRLESAGIHVVYGMLNLKTHCKLCLVVRHEHDGIRSYAHVGTGNYNASTAKIYTDVGVFTARPALIDEVAEVFNYLTGYSNRRHYRQLLVAPLNLRSQMTALIEREADHARRGRPARIIIKNNAIADPEMIRALYGASRAGVRIDLIVRGVCCLRPGIPGVSDNITVRSIVGRFLEHSRIYHFDNDGDPELLIGSADLMERNLDRRVESLCFIRDPAIARRLRHGVLDTMLADTSRAFELGSDGQYTRIGAADGVEPVDAQRRLVAGIPKAAETSTS